MRIITRAQILVLHRELIIAHGGGDVPEDELRRMIERSYCLIKPKVRKRNNDEES